MSLGTLPNRDATAVTAHLHRLRAAGMHTIAISHATGIPRGTLYNIANHRKNFVYGYTAARLLALTSPTPTAPTGNSFATGSTRRIQALVSIGWSIRSLRTDLDITNRPMYMITSGRLRYIRTATAQHITDLYRQRSDIPGPSKHATTWATKHGWVSPIAWDDDTIEDPDAAPYAQADAIADELAVELAIAGDRHIAARLNPIEQMYVIDALTNRQCSADAIADLLGTSRRKVQRDRRLLRELEGATT